MFIWDTCNVLKCPIYLHQGMPISQTNGFKFVKAFVQQNMFIHYLFIWLLSYRENLILSTTLG